MRTSPYQFIRLKKKNEVRSWLFYCIFYIQPIKISSFPYPQTIWKQTIYYLFKHHYPSPNLSYKDQGKEKRDGLHNKEKEKKKKNHLCPWFETTSKSGMESCNIVAMVILVQVKSKKRTERISFCNSGIWALSPFQAFFSPSSLISTTLTTMDFSLHHRHSQRSLLSGPRSQKFTLSRRLFFQSFHWHSILLYSALYSYIILSVVVFQTNYLI